MSVNVWNEGSTPAPKLHDLEHAVTAIMLLSKFKKRNDPMVLTFLRMAEHLLSRSFTREFRGREKVRDLYEATATEYLENMKQNRGIYDYKVLRQLDSNDIIIEVYFVNLWFIQLKIENRSHWVPAQWDVEHSRLENGEFNV